MNATYTLRYELPNVAVARTTVIPAAVKTVLMFAAAPLAGLAFLIAWPIAGFALLAWMLLKTLAGKCARILAMLRAVALFFAAPFIGLAYLMTFPFIAVGMLIWHATGRARC